MKRLNKPKIIKRVRSVFSVRQIARWAEELDVSSPTISKWRQLPVWQQTEAKLIEKTIEQEIEGTNLLRN
jgi:uncharacterized protein YjcR